MEDTAKKFYPLRPMQRWLIDTHFNKAKSTMMNIGALSKLSPLIDIPSFADAINTVLNTYDIFRCRFVLHPETLEICQTFDGEVMPVIIEEWTDQEFDMIKKYLAEPYDIIGKPLYRVYLFKTPSANYFYLDFYHAVADGTALAVIFLREIDKAFRGNKKKKSVPSYAEYIESQMNINPEELAEGHAYWQKMLAPFDPEKHLPPTKVQRDAAWTQGNLEYKFQNVSDEYFHKTHVKENHFFLGAAMLTLAKVTGSKSSIMSWIHNGRTTMREMRLFGLMLEQFPCAWDFHEDNSVEDFLSKLHGQIQIGMKYRKSLDMVYDNGLEDECVSFIFQKKFYEDFAFNDMNCSIVDLPPNEISAAENALDIEINSEVMGDYTVFLDYDSSLYSEAEMKNFAETMDKIILAMKNPKTLTSEILSDNF